MKTFALKSTVEPSLGELSSQFPILAGLACALPVWVRLARAPAGLVVTRAVSATLPVKPPAGVNVMVEVLPVVAPGATETAVPVRVKVGVTGVVTITVTLVLAEILPVAASVAVTVAV